MCEVWWDFFDSDFTANFPRNLSAKNVRKSVLRFSQNYDHQFVVSLFRPPCTRKSKINMHSYVGHVW